MNAGRDKNHIPTLIAALSTDGVTIAPVTANPANNALKVGNGTTGSDFGADIVRDQNRIPIAFVLSSADNKSLVPLYADASGLLQIKST